MPSGLERKPKRHDRVDITGASDRGQKDIKRVQQP
jgi:hypothetical protein